MRTAVLGGGASARQERQQFIYSTRRDGRVPGEQGKGEKRLPVRGAPFQISEKRSLGAMTRGKS